MFNLWSSPLRIVVAVVLLYQELGVAAFVAVGLLVIMTPVQKKLVTMASALLKKSLGSTDERVKLVGEVLGAMDVVKCYAWEVGRSMLALVSRQPCSSARHVLSTAPHIARAYVDLPSWMDGTRVVLIEVAIWVGVAMWFV